MGDTMWFGREVGEPPILEQEDGSCAVLIGGPPDWLRLPSELGGHQVRVLESGQAPCPKCNDRHPCRHLLVEGGYGVAECGINHEFYWYRLEG